MCIYLFIIFFFSIEFAGDNLFAQSAVFFMAGLDTTSLIIALAFLELAKNPVFQDRARREVEENFEEHGVTLAAFQEMKYLNQVILESLRLYPPAPILERIATKDYKVKPYLARTKNFKLTFD